MKIKLLKFQVLTLFLLSIITFGYSPPYYLSLHLNTNNIETIINIPQNVNQSGLIVVKGNLIKKITSNNVLLSIQYLDDNNNWTTKWSRNLNAQIAIDESQEVFFELPPSNVEFRKIKIIFTSEGGTLLNDDVIWDKSISHYNYGDYSTNTSCSIDETKYTILITPKDNNVVYDINGNIVGIKDKINSNIIFNKKETLLKINKPATLISENGTKSLKITNNGNINDILAQTPEINYADTLGRPSPYLYSYNDPVYIFAGKFSVNGFKLKFSQWPGDSNGPGYHDFSNPNQLTSRYFNLYNTIDQKLNDLITDQEPVVFVSSRLTGFRVYKQDGSIINLTGYNNYSPSAYFGYPPDQGGGDRGPGSENFIISNTSNITLFGMGAIANRDFSTIDKPISEINSEISNFIKYTGIFGQNNNCYTIDPNAIPNYSDEVDKNVLAAPNSYIYNINLAKSNNYGGIYIPVKKAYDVWRDTKGFINQSIPSLNQSASVVWQDKENLISSVSIVGSGINAKLKVEVNPTKGKGNAVVALHIGNKENDSDPIYWSWHIWVTDDPTNGVTYVNNGDSRMINTFMDRNLGALSNSFLGHDWNKSGGLLYQWGRKDPFPRLVYTDGSRADFYIKNQRGNDITDFIKYVLSRPYDGIYDNLKYSIQNPLNFINRTEQTGAWFASSNNRIKKKDSNGYAEENYDLWGDNSKGITKKESFEKQIKSPYDPCPAGWRVPSFAHSNSTVPNFSPWGSKYNYVYNENGYHEMTESSNRYPNVKFYPGMGIDFQNGNDNHYLGMYPTTGAYKLLLSGKLSFQDSASETALWSATLDQQVQGRGLYIINDPLNRGGRYVITTASEAPTGEGLAVRCSKDEITNLTFDTEYFNETKRNYREGLDSPNSYILFNERSKEIPVSKAYAVHNQMLTNREWIPNGQQTANVYWTTNKNLVKSLDITGVGENAKINVQLNDNQYGNAVVSLHIGNQGNSNDPVYWSWHIWVPIDNPEINPTDYITDKGNKISNFKIFNTESGFPPIKNTFMKMPLGALKKFDTPAQYQTNFGYGLWFQWGRKDPLPTFYDGGAGTVYEIYKGLKQSNTIVYESIKVNMYDAVDEYTGKGYQVLNKQNELDAKEMKRFSIQNPLTFLYNTYSSSRDWLTNNLSYEMDRWGHASRKSIYDPCPEGWRVPDYGFNTKINSPWANTDFSFSDGSQSFDNWNVSQKYSDYNITENKRSTSIVRSFFYKDPVYDLGFHLAATGFRGSGSTGISIHEVSRYSTIWSATIGTSKNGYGLSLDTSLATGIHNLANVNKISDARAIVCAKDKPKFSKEYFENLSVQNIANRTLNNIDTEINQLNNLNFYPNPVGNILKTNSKDQLNVEIYSISGEKVLFGRFNNQELNVSQLKTGVYVLVLENGKTYKIIKK